MPSRSFIKMLTVLLRNSFILYIYDMIFIMPELRLNMVTKEWVIIATERARRPEDFILKRNKKILPEFHEFCPFCPGNEHKTPNEIMRIASDQKWLVRVIPNKFAALSSDGQRFRTNEGLKHLMTGIGRHEVIIESPLHNKPTALLPVEDIANVLMAYRERFINVYNIPFIEHVIIFKNQGENSGTSIIHPHSQLIGIPVVPFQVRERIFEARRYFDNTGSCLMCDTLKDELADGRRVIANTEHFVTFIPYAALSPFHIWLFPKRHSATFGDILDDEINDLAFNLKLILSKLYNGLENPDFNYVIRSEHIRETNSEYFHWYISIVPRVSQASGFELGSGMYTNPSIPEEVAEFLRSIKAC
jgi:UDPglucose--hexose-1-phosphate uridylyltransferase